jgi:hypothetical protein
MPNDDRVACAAAAADGESCACGGGCVDDGRLFSWGSGRGFKLGFDSEEDAETPQIVTLLAKGKVVLQAICGFDRSIALVGMAKPTATVHSISHRTV